MEWITQFLSQFLADYSQASSMTYAVAAIFMAYVGGLLSSLTPCVYPMIPITVSVIGGMGPNKPTWKEVFTRGLTYVLGMTVVYSFLGVLAGISGKLFGSLTHTSGWYLGLGLVMTLAALIMLEVLPFDPLLWWNQFKRLFKKNQQPKSFSKKEISLLGAFSLGASSGFIAAPCTTPVLTAILAYIAGTQSLVLGFILMLAFSLGLGTLLIVIASFAGALQKLPRSGQWMKVIKIISGMILLAFAGYLIYLSGTMAGTTAGT